MSTWTFDTRVELAETRYAPTLSGRRAVQPHIQARETILTEPTDRDGYPTDYDGPGCSDCKNFTAEQIAALSEDRALDCPICHGDGKIPTCYGCMELMEPCPNCN